MDTIPQKPSEANPKGQISCFGLLAYFVVIIGEIFLGLPLVKWVMTDLLGVAKTDDKGVLFGTYTWQVILVWFLLDRMLRWVYKRYFIK